MKKKSVGPQGYVLHVMKENNLIDAIYPTAKERDAAGWQYLWDNPGKLIWKTQTRRTA